MGALERDNVKTNTGFYDREDASPLAIIDRSRLCSMLGGNSEWEYLVKEKKRNNMKVILDCMTRVSSSRYDKKYRDKLVYELDEIGKL